MVGPAPAHRVWPAPGCSGTVRGPDKLALTQSARCQPNADAVVHEDLQTVGALVGEQVGMVRLRRTEDGDHARQCRVGSGPHVQWCCGQPGLVDADHLRMAAVQLASSAAGP